MLCSVAGLIRPDQETVSANHRSDIRIYADTSEAVRHRLAWYGRQDRFERKAMMVLQVASFTYLYVARYQYFLGRICLNRLIANPERDSGHRLLCVALTLGSLNQYWCQELDLCPRVYQGDSRVHGSGSTPSATVLSCMNVEVHCPQSLTRRVDVAQMMKRATVTGPTAAGCTSFHRRPNPQSDSFCSTYKTTTPPIAGRELRN